MRAGLADAHHGRNQRLVVVAGHGASVRAGDRHGEDVATLDVGGQAHFVDDDVAGFAVHAHHAAQFRLGGTGAVGESRGVVRAVQRRTDVVAHAAVDGHVDAFGDGVAVPVFRVAAELHRLDGAHTVQRDAGRRDRPASRFEGDDGGRHAERAVHRGDRVGETAELHVDVHRILAVGVRHGVAAAEVDLGQRVRIGGVEGLAQQHHALGRLDEGVGVVDVGADVGVDADQFEHVLTAVDVFEHGERRAVRDQRHGLGELAVAVGDLLMTQVVWIAHVVLQLAFGVVPDGLRGIVPGGVRFGMLAQFRVAAGRRHVGEVVEHVEFAGVGARRKQCDAEFLVLVRGGDEFVAAGVDAGGDAQHDACALAELLGDARDALRFVRLVHDDLREALFDGEFDFRVGLVVAVQHQAASGDAGGERDAHLAHRAGVDEHAGFGDDAADLLAQQGLAGEADMGDGVVERVRCGLDEFRGAGAHVVGVDDVQRGAELVEQAFRGASVEGDFAVGVHRRAGRPDWSD